MLKKLTFSIIAIIAATCSIGMCKNFNTVNATKEGINLYDKFEDENVVDENKNITKLYFVVTPPFKFKDKILNNFVISENKDGQQLKNFDEIALKFFDTNENLVFESKWNKIEIDNLGLKECNICLNLDKLQDDITYIVKIFGRNASKTETFVGKRQFCKKNIEEYRNDVIKHNEENHKIDQNRMEDYIVNKDGKTVSDQVNICYADSFDGDYKGAAEISLRSDNNGRFHDSVFFGRNNIRVEFFDENNKHVLTKNAVCKNDSSFDCHQSNEFKVNKFELEFKKTYNLKFYDETQPSNDENLLGTFKLHLAQPQKSSDLNDFKFFIDNYNLDGINSLNVRSGSTNERISDRLRFTFNWPLNDSNMYDEVKVECLSNLNNSDSIFKNHESLIVDVVDENGNVVLSKKTGPTQNFDGLNVVKSKMFKIESGELIFDKKYDLKFYDGNDEQKLNLLAYYSGFAHHGLGDRSELVVE